MTKQEKIEELCKDLYECSQQTKCCYCYHWVANDCELDLDNRYEQLFNDTLEPKNDVTAFEPDVTTDIWPKTREGIEGAIRSLVEELAMYGSSRQYIGTEGDKNTLERYASHFIELLDVQSKLDDYEFAKACNSCARCIDLERDIQEQHARLMESLDGWDDSNKQWGHALDEIEHLRAELIRLHND